MGYQPSSELETLIEQLVGEQKEQFFESLGNQFPHTIRFNTLYGDEEELADFFKEQGFDFEPFPGLPGVYRILFQPYPIGKSLSHFLGHIYVQDVSSMLPPMVLQPEPGNLVMDMSAAPGSKTTQMAIMMQNRGFILANDIVPKRLRALINNLQRMGIVNTAVVKNYGESLGNTYFETFDKILLDPACSGLGTLHKNPEVLSWWTENHCVRLASGQKQMLKSALKALKPGGEMVYSTCTLTPQENEEVLDFALREFPIEILPIELPGLVTRPGLTCFQDKSYHPQVENSIRIYPFENQTEGFFVAKIRKTGPMERDSRKRQREPLKFDYISHNTSPVKKYLDYLSLHLGIERKDFSRFRYFLGKEIVAVTPELADFPFRSKPMRAGLTIGRPLTQAAKLTTEGCLVFGAAATKNFFQLESMEELHRFVNRDEFNSSTSLGGQVLVRYKNFNIGYGLADGEKLKSQFPKAEWPFQVTMSERDEEIPETGNEEDK